MPADAAVLPPAVVARFTRPFEVFLTDDVRSPSGSTDRCHAEHNLAALGTDLASTAPLLPGGDGAPVDRTAPRRAGSRVGGEGGNRGPPPDGADPGPCRPCPPGDQ